MIHQGKEQQTRSLGTDCSHLHGWSNAKNDDSLTPHLWTLDPCPSWFPLWLHVICGVQEWAVGPMRPSIYKFLTLLFFFMVLQLSTSPLLTPSIFPPSHLREYFLAWEKPSSFLSAFKKHFVYRYKSLFFEVLWGEKNPSYLQRGQRQP